MFDFDAFRALFPVFDCMSDEEIQPAVDLACALYGEFCHVPEGKARDLMTSLAVAHELKLGDCLMQGGQIKRLKNQQDEVEYAITNADDPFGLQSTVYGARLARLSRAYCVPAGLIGGGIPSMYTSDIGFMDNCGCDW